MPDELLVEEGAGTEFSSTHAPIEEETARSQAEQELENLYGFNFQQIAVRNDERLEETPGKLVEEGLERKEKYKSLGKAGEYVMLGGLTGATLAINAGNTEAFGILTGLGMLGYIGGTAAVSAGQSHEEIGLQEFNRVENPEKALNFLEGREYVRAEGELPYTVSSGEEAATDLEDLFSTGDSMIFYREHDEPGEENRFELVCYTSNYPRGDAEGLEPEEYVISGYTEEGLEPEGGSPTENLDEVREFLAVDEGPDPEENQMVRRI